MEALSQKLAISDQRPRKLVRVTRIKQLQLQHQKQQHQPLKTSKMSERSHTDKKATNY